MSSFSFSNPVEQNVICNQRWKERKKKKLGVEIMLQVFNL